MRKKAKTKRAKKTIQKIRQNSIRNSYLNLHVYTIWCMTLAVSKTKTNLPHISDQALSHDCICNCDKVMFHRIFCSPSTRMIRKCDQTKMMKQLISTASSDSSMVNNHWLSVENGFSSGPKIELTYGHPPCGLMPISSAILAA